MDKNLTPPNVSPSDSVSDFRNGACWFATIVEREMKRLERLDGHESPWRKRVLDELRHNLHRTLVRDLEGVLLSMALDNANKEEAVKYYNDGVRGFLAQHRSLSQRLELMRSFREALRAPGLDICSSATCARVFNSCDGFDGHCTIKCRKHSRDRSDYLRRRAVSEIRQQDFLCREETTDAS
jgi:hypothetical protein